MVQDLHKLRRGIGIFLGRLRFGTRGQVSPKVGRRRQPHIMCLGPALEHYNTRQGDAGAMIKSLSQVVFLLVWPAVAALLQGRVAWCNPLCVLVSPDPRSGFGNMQYQILSDTKAAVVFPLLVSIPPPAVEHRIRRKISEVPEAFTTQVVTQQAPDSSVGGGRAVRLSLADLPDVPAGRTQPGVHL